MNEFVILYVITIGILIFDSITLGLINAKLDILEAEIEQYRGRVPTSIEAFLGLFSTLTFMNLYFSIVHYYEYE